MSLSLQDILQVAELARLNLSTEHNSHIQTDLSRIMKMIDQINEISTDKIEPMAHPLDVSQRLRPDIVTEEDQRAVFLKLAPLTEAGLFLVPKVID